jgi:uncharacterized protein
VRRVEADAVVVGSERVRGSFLLSPERIVPDWPPHRAAEIDAAATQGIFALDPELVLVGSGTRQEFVSAEVQAAFLRRGIGIECMDNHACAHTFNLLAGEGRRVVAAFLQPPAGAAS